MSDLIPHAPNNPLDLSIEDIKVHIIRTSGNPHIGKTHQVTLKNGPRTFRIATIFEILDPVTGGVHHLSLHGISQGCVVRIAHPHRTVHEYREIPIELL